MFLAKIWIEGFSHLLAFIGFISAALTITQKENLMNLIGGFIIMWRESFAEGDFVSIHGHQGIVKNIGIFYFTLQEIQFESISNRSRKVVKIPNAFVSIHPFEVYNYDNFLLFERNLTFDFTSDLKTLKTLVNHLQDEIEALLSELQVSYSKEQNIEYKKLQAKKECLKPSVTLTICQVNAPMGYLINVSMYCLIENEIQFNTLIENVAMDFILKSKVLLAHN